MNKKFFLFCMLLLLPACSSSQYNQSAKLPPLDISEAVMAYNDEDCAKAIQIFSEASNRQENPILLNGLGMSYLQCAQPESAVNAFSRAVSLAPQSSALHANLATAYYESNQIEEAKTSFENALELDPNLIEAIVGKATILIYEKKPEQALKILYDHAKKFPDNPILKYNQAIALYEMGMYVDSIKLFKEYLAVNETDAQAYNALAVAYQQNKEPDNALASIDKAISLYPVDGIFYYNKGNILKDMNKYAEAEKEYSRAISFLPTMAEAYVNRGDINFLLRNVEESCRDLNKACDLGICERLKIYQDAGRCLNKIWD